MIVPNGSAEDRIACRTIDATMFDPRSADREPAYISADSSLVSGRQSPRGGPHLRVDREPAYRAFRRAAGRQKFSRWAATRAARIEIGTSRLSSRVPGRQKFSRWAATRSADRDRHSVPIRRASLDARVSRWRLHPRTDRRADWHSPIAARLGMPEESEPEDARPPSTRRGLPAMSHCFDAV
jgi:hypothetical protein